MKNTFPLVFLIVGALGACTPDIAQTPPPAKAIVAEFDPANAAEAIVPSPNDLALTSGSIVVPVPQGCPGAAPPATPPPATASDGIKDGDETDVDCGGSSEKACDAGKACIVYEDCASGNCTNGLCVGGCPSAAQQEFDSEYLGSLSGFPFETTAQALVTGDLDPTTVSASSVLVLDVTSGTPVPVTGAVVSYAARAVGIAPPPGGWTRAGHYAIALLAGAGGLQGQAGEAVIGSPAWGLVSSPNPLVTCPDLKTNCAPTVDVLPSDLTDPAARLAQQTSEAIELEQIRRIYDPILTALESQGHARTDVPLVWTFTIVDAGEMTFDPADSVIPFPNDVLRSAAATGLDGGTAGPLVQLPNPVDGGTLTAADCASPTLSLVQLFCGLNTLDGFSTLAAPISENSDTAGAVDQATIDGTTLSTTSAGLLAVASTAPAPEMTTPEFTPCLNCVSSTSANGTPQTSPQQLQWSLQAPLDEKTTYLAYVTTAVKDTSGKSVIANPVFALVRSQNTLLTSDMKSAVTLLTDAQANALEPIRAALAPALSGLEQGGTSRASLALAWGFTTQSEASLLDQLATFPAMATDAGLPDVPLALDDVTTAYTAAAGLVPVPVTNVGKFYTGVMLSEDLATGPSGTFNPDPTQAKPLPIDFLVAVPASAPPAAGYPVAIFGHGLERSRNDLVPIANALTGAGFLAIATDAYFHGDRTSCTGSSLATASSLPAGATPSDDYACNNPAAAGGNETCDEDPLDGQCILTGATATRDACVFGAYDATGDAGCAAKGQGRCAADGKCQGIVGNPVPCSGATSDAANSLCASQELGVCDATTNVCTGSSAGLARAADGTPLLSGWNFLNTSNFFATRDNFRQQVIDLSQLVLLLESTSTTAGPNLNAGLQGLLGSSTPIIDATHIDYVGLSLGGILGTLFNAVSPNTTNVALNVPGGNLTTLFLESPDLATPRAAFLQALSASGITQGTPQFDSFIGLAQWVLDPADPENMGYRLTHGVNPGTGIVAPNANRKVFIQFIEDDQLVINASNLALIAGANRSFNQNAPPSFGCVSPLFCYEFTQTGDGFDTTSLPLESRHGFLLNFVDSAITTEAQTQVTSFLTAGTAP
ncbi:MAG TPA: hypothetical protein VEK07_24965 [Polyangiaceae bacterium]|nr:hypothetical protein [Polyangiaceae bacterium]